MTEDRKSRLMLQVKLAAIAARVDGKFDHPALLHFGPLTTIQEDIRRIVRADIPDEATVQRLHDDWDTYSETEN
jgi:hypothetical protein